jgi:signal transduction histidine kinase
MAGAAPAAAAVTATNGLLREYWTNFFVRDFSALQNRSPSESTVRIQSPRLTVSGSGELPAPRRVIPSESPGITANLLWAEIEGTVSFAAATEGKLQLELAGDRSNVRVQVFNWHGGSAARLDNSRVRVRGVWERVTSIQRNIFGGVMRVPDERYLTVLPRVEGADPDPNSVLISEIEPSNPAMTWGRRITVQGRVASKDSATALLLQGDDVFQGYCSADGTNWNRIGKPVAIGMSNSVLVGLAVASHQSVNPANATFDQVEGPGTSWLSAVIYGRQTGEYKITGSTYMLRGSGRQIAQTTDNFYFLCQPLNGEGEIKARLDSLACSDPLAQAGLMIRESLDRKSVYAAVLSAPEGGAKFQCRKVFGEFPAEFVPQTGKPWMKVVRSKNCVPVRAREALNVQPGQEVNITGTLVWENGAPVLEEAFGFVIASENIRSADTERVLRNGTIEELLAILQRPSQPYQREYLEVSGLRGVVTFCDRVMNANTLFIQDGASGIPLSWADTNLTVPLRAGQLVRVSGRATVGRSPVVLDAETLTVMGWGTLPEAVRYSAGHFTSQSRHGQWVETEGVVRASGENGVLNIMGKEGRLAAWLGHAQAASLKQYVNARVRVRGVLSLIPGNDPLLLIPSPEYVEIREPTPADPFAIPAFSAAALADLSLKPEELRRMKASGIVTGLRAKELFIQDDTGGVCVRTLEEPAVKIGDLIEVVGFPGGFPAVILNESMVRKTGVGRLPDPVLIPPGERDIAKYAGKLVRLEAVVLEQRDSRGGQRLSLQAGPGIHEAVFAATDNRADRVPVIPVGSRVAVTGVCQVNRSTGNYGGGGKEADVMMTTCQIWLRTPADVVLLQRPPWWTWKHTAVVVCLFAGGLLATLVWVRTLRRRVQQRTRELQEATRRLEKEIQTSAVLAERDRLAGEIHDSVEQGLTAIMLQLDAAEKQADNPDQARRCIKLARGMAGFSRGEVQHAVWDLQSPLLENADLGAALTHVANEISSGTSPMVTVNIIGEVRQLPSSVEHHLLRIGQEAITNAVKHARPESVRVTLEYADHQLRLSVQDDGIGFVPDAAFKAGQSGHFGLQGIRERAKKIDSTLAVSSSPGQGTTITVTTALAGNGAGPTEKVCP